MKKIDSEIIYFVKSVGKNIRTIRKEKHMNQTQLSILANINRGHISKIERGKIAISLDTLYRLKRALKVDIDRFFV